MTNVDDERTYRQSRRQQMRNRLLDILAPPAPPPPGGFVDSLPEAFGALDEHGEVFVIGYKGEWFVPVSPTLRVRIHNLIVNAINRNGDLPS